MLRNEDTGDRAKPLAGLTVIDFTTALAGPFATLLLGGLGATVIKVENPNGGDHTRHQPPYLQPDGETRLDRTGGDDISVGFIGRCRNKRSVTLNLKHPEGRRLAHQLLEHADIVVENYSQGVADRLDIGYAAARARNPAVVYLSISGFGADGPPEQGKAYDTIAQALSGIMLTAGEPGADPVKLGIPFGDLMAPMFGVIGTLAAVRHAERTGEGQHVDVSMVGALSAIVALEPFEALERLGIPSRNGNFVPRLGAFGIFPTREGHVAVCAPTDGFAHALFKLIQRPDMIDDPRFRTRDDRTANREPMYAAITEWTRQHPTGHVVAELRAAGIPAAAVRDPAAAARDPETMRRGETVRLPHPRHGLVGDPMGFGVPLRFSALSAELDGDAPGLGEHNEATFTGLLGLAPEELARLRDQGAI